MLLLTSSLIVKGQSDDRFNVNHGVVVQKIDSSLKSKIQTLQFGSSIGVIFPAEYSSSILSSRYDSNFVQTFTPDSNLIRMVEGEIVRQYCHAEKQWQDEKWEEDKNYYSRIWEHKELKKAKKRYHYWLNYIDTACPRWQYDLRYIDKQFMGYITKAGEKIIYVQLCDFREDPYKLKNVFKESWIQGWHGWFYTHCRFRYFNINKNTSTINGDG
ncbi:MAG: hypothetical protein U0T79_09510 [Ferruginibacter sp.]